MNEPKRTPRTLEEAFGAHTSRHIGAPRAPGIAVRAYMRLRHGDPLFADSPAASRAIGIALILACAVVAWLLATGR
jgi:hypothetical protein